VPAAFDLLKDYELYPNSSGRKRTMFGKMISAKSAIIKTMKNGKISRIISVNGIPVTAFITKRRIP
jgi:hypothetical protein